MKSIGKAVLYFLAWGILTVLLGAILSGGKEQVSDGVMSFSAIASIVILILLANRKKKSNNLYSTTKQSPVLYTPNSQANNRQASSSTPSTKTKELVALNKESAIWQKHNKLPSVRKCREIADNYVAYSKRKMQYAFSAESIMMFFSWAEDVREGLKQAIWYEEKAGYSFSERPSTLLNQFERDFQWKLRDAIEREEKYLISEIGGRQRNNKKECCNRFYQEIQSHKEFFSEDTIDFAMDAYYRICEEAGLTPQINGKLIEGKNSLAEVDLLDGHAFEAFCADLLRKNGFQKVETTKGSGDQGVDILAEKDGIRFAIQCKCYSSDLGNKPVQEVFAGKSIYNCQVAVVMTNRYFTVGGLEAAKATGGVMSATIPK